MEIEGEEHRVLGRLMEKARESIEKAIADPKGAGAGAALTEEEKTLLWGIGLEFPTKKASHIKKAATRISAALPREGNGSSVTRVAVAAAQGDQEAWAKLWEHYGAAIRTVARVRLGEIKQRGIKHLPVDEDDIALSAFSAFWSLSEKGRVRVENREDLWALMMMLTIHKVSTQVYRWTHLTRGGGRKEIPLESVIDRIASKESTPEFVASFQEQLDHLMHILKEDALREIASRLLEGQRIGEIASDMGLTRATVQRKLAIIRMTWAEELRE
jgi:DNA-directed RNA polymerase specialized sigma24 family protein